MTISPQPAFRRQRAWAVHVLGSRPGGNVRVSFRSSGPWAAWQAALLLAAAAATTACIGASPSASGATGTAPADTAAESDVATAGNNTDTVSDAVAAEVASSADGAADSAADAAAAGSDTPKADTTNPCGKDCNAGLPVCKKGVCDPGSGACVISDSNAACDDGDPCTQADNCLVGVCTGMPKPNCCTPKCAGKICGGDGCGGSCGSCKPGESCAEGACVAASAEAGESCKDALTIGAIPYVHTGSTANKQNDLQAPDKACYNAPLGTYGADVVYKYTPTADGSLHIWVSGYANSPQFYVATDCADIKNTCVTGSGAFGLKDKFQNWAKVTKGTTLYIVVDADGAGGEYTLHVDPCATQCAGKVCGYDGCGGDCGFCKKLSNEQCSTAGQCVCVGNCDGKDCGSDGCGKSCGGCGGGQVCDASGHCTAANQKGDTCVSATVVGPAAYTNSGSTVGMGNDIYGWAFCQGNGTGAYIGYEAPDAVYKLGGGKSEAWFVDLVKASTNLDIYAFADCGDPTTCKQASYKAYTLKKRLFVETPTGAPLYVAVDGYATQAGTFTVSFKPCVQAADCPDATPGEYCSFPIAVGPLPFKTTSSGSLDSYHLPVGACGSVKAKGKGGQDRAFALVATKSGVHTVSVQSTGGADAVLYATKDCTKLATTCASFADKDGANGKEKLTVDAKAGETWYIVVDNTGTVTGGFSLDIAGP